MLQGEQTAMEELLVPFNFKEFEDRVITGLRESGLIDKFSVFEYTQTPNQELLFKYFEKPSLIKFDEQGLYFEENGNKTYCPKMLSSITKN